IQECKVLELKATDASSGNKVSNGFVSYKGNVHCLENDYSKTGNDQRSENQGSTSGNDSSRSGNKCSKRRNSRDDTYGYSKNRKKTVKTGQTRTRDGKDCTRAEDLIARKDKTKRFEYQATRWQKETSPKHLIGRDPQGMTRGIEKKHTKDQLFALKQVQKKYNEPDTRNATLAICVLT
ncbi:hypothetical protein Tco_1063784, partial [Tanacetum coccineum]